MEILTGDLFFSTHDNGEHIALIQKIIGKVFSRGRWINRTETLTTVPVITVTSPAVVWCVDSDMDAERGSGVQEPV